MTDEELMQRLSSENSQLKVIVARTKHHNLMVYAMNNVLMEQNEKLNEQLKERSTMTKFLKKSA